MSVAAVKLRCFGYVASWFAIPNPSEEPWPSMAAAAGFKRYLKSQKHSLKTLGVLRVLCG
jgi:hypothetical protein